MIKMISRPLWPLLLFSALTLASCVRQAPPVTGTLEGEVHWKGTVRIAGDVILAEGSNLTIAPGTTVLFLSPPPGTDSLVDHPHFPGSELIIRGSVTAVGRADSPITFRFEDPAAEAGSWGGVNLQQSPSAVFRFCRFTQADSAIHSQESKVTVVESLFEGNLVALRFHTTDILIENNSIRRNGTGIRFHFGSPTIRWNDIRENRRGFFFTSYPEDFFIEQNAIVANTEFSVVLGEEVPDDVPMRANWWGGIDFRQVETSLFDGRRFDHLGRVLFSPMAGEPIRGAGISWTP